MDFGLYFLAFYSALVLCFFIGIVCAALDSNNNAPDKRLEKDYRCVYPDGDRSVRMTYKEAKSLAASYNGEVVADWKGKENA